MNRGVLLMALAGALGGCAGPAEQRAFERWTRIDADAFTAVDASSATPGKTPSASSHRSNTLEALVAEALRESPQVRAAFERWKAALEDIPQARSLPDAQFSIALMIDEVDARGDYMGERYAIQQMFPWFGKLAARTDVAVEAARAAEHRYEAQRLATVNGVRQMYYEHRVARRSLEIAEQNAVLLQQFEEIFRTLLRTGQATQPDVLRAQMELAELQSQVESLRDMVQAAAHALGAAVGRSGAIDPVVEAMEIGAIVTAAIDVDQLIRRARQNNPELAALRCGAAEQRAAIAAARRESWPDIMLGVAYGRGTQARMAIMDRGGEDSLEIMASVEIPLWRERYDAMTRQRLARFGAATRDVQARDLTVAADLARAAYRFRDGQRRYELYGQTLLPSARQSQATLLASYRAGDASFLDLINAHRVLLEFELARERALTESLQALAELEMLIGGPIAPRATEEESSDE